MYSHADKLCACKARMILVEFASRVIQTRSVICAVQTPIPLGYVNGCRFVGTLA